MTEISNERLGPVRGIPELVQFLRGELGWPVALEDLDEDTFDYCPDELGVEVDAARRRVKIRQWRPPAPAPPWGIFFLEVQAGPLSVTVLSRLLRVLVGRERQSPEAVRRRTWSLEDLLFICSHREEDRNAVTFVHFSQPPMPGRAARLTSWGWTDKSRTRAIREFHLPRLRWPADTARIADGRERWRRAFDKQELTEVFWREFRVVFEALQKDLAAQTRDPGWAHDYALQFLNRCLFLCFIQQKRWLGDDPDFLRTFWTAYTTARPEPNTFYARWLKVLFLELGAGRCPGGHTPFPQDIGAALRSAPYLDGGLFAENDLDRRHEFLLRDERFLQVLTFLERYDFTAREDTPLDRQVAIDAEMLGRVCEGLVNRSEEADERGDAGIFYTPRAEIDLMCRLALVDYLANHLGATRKSLLYEAVFAGGPLEKRDADARLGKEELWVQLDTLLRRITVMDPACGSGSFLVGMLQVLDDLAERANRALGRRETSYERRQRIIARSLYGMDVMPWAVEAAEPRLWLQLIIEADLPAAERKSRPRLPGLSFHIRCGDSLLQGWNPARTPVASYDREVVGVAAARPPGPKGRCASGPRADRQTIGKLILADATQVPAVRVGKSDILPASVRETQAIPDFLPGRRFDIVIGNPPYVRQEKIRDPRLPRAEATAENKRRYKAKLAATVSQAYPSFFGGRAGPGSAARRLNAQSDLYVYFYFRGLSLLAEKGTFCFLTSNSWLDVAYGAALQEFLLRQCHMKMILDNQARRSFASADVNTVVTLLSPPAGRHDEGLGQVARFITFRVPFEQVSSAVLLEIEAASERRTTPEYRVLPIRQDHLLQDGCELSRDESVRHGPSGPRLRAARYDGNKWGGKFLRAPDVFHRIREKAGPRLVPLGTLGKVRYPIKTGINDFFYLDEKRAAEFGVDRSFLVRVVKSPREFRSIRLREADVSRFLFSCPLSPADLAARGCSGTLAYIQWGARQKTVARQKSTGGLPWPQVPSVQGRPQWYSINRLAPADVICNRFFHDRFFFGFADFPVVEDQTFYGCTFTLPEACRRAQIAVLNSTLQFLLVELLGRIGLGEGVLQYATYEMAQMLTLDARRFTEEQCNRIVCAFEPLAERPLARVEQEVASGDRRSFDDCVFDVLGLTYSEREAVYEAVVNLVDARLKKAASLLPQREQEGHGRGPPEHPYRLSAEV
jgi:hypothetical protein